MLPLKKSTANSSFRFAVFILLVYCLFVLAVANQAICGLARYYGGESSHPLIVGLCVLFENLLLTFFRALLSIPFGIFIGIGIGLLLRLINLFQFSQMLVTVFRSIPLIALIPLFTYWLGSGFFGVFMYIVVCTSIVVTSDVYEASGVVPQEYEWYAKMCGYQGWRYNICILLPGMFATVLASIRQIIGFSLAFAVGGEFVAANHGVGKLLLSLYRKGDFEMLVYLVITVCLSGLLLYLFINTLMLKLISERRDSDEIFN